VLGVDTKLMREKRAKFVCMYGDNFQFCISSLCLFTPCKVCLFPFSEVRGHNDAKNECENVEK